MKYPLTKLKSHPDQWEHWKDSDYIKSSSRIFENESLSIREHVCKWIYTKCYYIDKLPSDSTKLWLIKSIGKNYVRGAMITPFIVYYEIYTYNESHMDAASFLVGFGIPLALVWPLTWITSFRAITRNNTRRRDERTQRSKY